jgi:hypothetical protein
MGIKSLLAKPFASYISRSVTRASGSALMHQELIFKSLISAGKKTAFGREHAFANIRNMHDFSQVCMIRDYEGIRPYVNRIIDGEEDVLWPGKPLYFAKTSGTTSGVKYIPISRQSMGNQIRSARNALLMHIAHTGNSSFADGKMIFLSGSPELEYKRGIATGRLSGIVNHHVPAYLQSNKLPSFKTNCIEDWEQKVDAIVEETIHEDMRLISGIPPWVQMYFDKLVEKAGKPVGEIFPNFSLFVYGGVNYEPYRSKIEATIGKKIGAVEVFPASEGFMAYSDSTGDPGLMLIVNDGIFYEFIPVNEFGQDNPKRVPLEGVKEGINYVMILNTNAGLWGYNIGDTVRFVSTNPYRILITGRVKFYISAFGEHVIAEEVEKALLQVAKAAGVEVSEFTVAPQVSPVAGLPHHEWFIDFVKTPDNMEAFSQKLDDEMRRLNIYYDDLIKGHILKPLVISLVERSGFMAFMKSQGKLGGQNKVPRLANDRVIAEGLSPFLLKSENP